MSAEEELERLRSLLLGTNKERIDDLHGRVENPETRAVDVAEVLADASLLAQQRYPENFAVALQEPVSAAMANAIEQNPQRIADILFPIIMPAIRRAIADAMRQLSERVDTLLTRQLSYQSFKWRIEAARSGVPFREVVLRETLQFQVEQVLLIENGSGLLMQHLQLPDLPSVADSDAVSGMLWAIENFVRDSFTRNPDEGLNRVTMGDHIVYLAHGPEATMACVVRGVATPEFIEHMGHILSRLHGLYHRQLSTFDGDKSQLDITYPLLNTCFQCEMRTDEKGPKNTGGLAKILLLLCLASLLVWAGWMAFQRYRENNAIEQYIQRLNDTPGIVMLDASRKDAGWQLRGMRDPKSADPATLLQGLPIEPSSLQLKLTPYISLEPELQVPRIRIELEVPDSVTLDLEDGRLAMTGAGPLAWVDAIRFRSALPDGVSKLDTRKLQATPESLEQFVRETLALPLDSKLVVDGSRIQLLTPMDERQRDEVRAINATLDGLASLEVIQWVDGKSAQIKERVSSLDGRHFKFMEGDELTPESRSDLENIAEQLVALNTMLDASPQHLRVTVVGRSSASGDDIKNRQIRLARADAIRKHLINAGLPVYSVAISVGNLDEAALSELGEDARRADLVVELDGHAN